MAKTHVECFESGPLGCLCSIVADLDAKTALVIDPGGDAEYIEERLAALGCTLARVVHTHTHFDHVGATPDLQNAHGCPCEIHEATCSISSRPKPRLVSAGVPRRMPEGSKGLRGSKGTVL